MTSSALFASVALSTVILRPMLHVGCCSASASVARSRRSRGHVRNGPPDAVSTRRRTSCPGRPAMHCRMAECSLSTGTSSPPPSRAAACASSPATTSVSLFASATRLPARSAARVASSPAAPTTALSTMSASGRVAASTRQSVPVHQPSSAPAVAPPSPTRPDEARSVAGRLFSEQRDVAMRRERGDVEAVRLPFEHAQRGRPDGARRAEDRDAPSPSSSPVAGRRGVGRGHDRPYAGSSMTCSSR